MRHLRTVLAALIFCSAAGCVEPAPGSSEENGNDAGAADAAVANTDAGAVPADAARDGGAPGDAASPDSGLPDAAVDTVDSTSISTLLDSLFTFENTLQDSVGTAQFYATSVTYSDANPIEGLRSIRLNNNFIAETNNSFEQLQERLVVGGWVRDRSASDASTWISHSNNDGSQGWSVGRSEDELECVLRSGSVSRASGLPVSNYSDWNHLLCEFDISNGRVTARPIVNGVPGDVITADYSNSNELFRVGGWITGSGFDGEVDELVVATSAAFNLVYQRKLWACGANGTLCKCQADNPSKYVECGRDEECNDLAECAF